MKKIIFSILLFFPLLCYSQIDSISNGESGLSVRNKLNRLIDTANNYMAPKTMIGDSTQAAYDSIVNTIRGLDSVVFNQSTTALSWLKWKMFADSAMHAVSLHMDAMDVTLQIGMEMYLYGRNVSGSTMYNFTAARIIGSTGEWANMDICGIGSVDSARFVGLATHDIPNNEFGFFTTYGSSRLGNSSYLTQGKRVFLSHAGGLRSDTVNYPYEMFQVGFCINSHTQAGEILVQPLNTTLNHPSGSVLYVNGNREEASDTGIIKREDGQIKIDSANIDVYTDGTNSYTLTELAQSGAMTEDEINDSLKIKITRVYNDTIKFDYRTTSYGIKLVTDTIIAISDTTDYFNGNTSMVVYQANGTGSYVDHSNFENDSKYSFDTTPNMLNFCMYMIHEGYPGFNIYRKKLKDVVSPQRSSMVIGNSLKDRIVLTYDENLIGSTDTSEWSSNIGTDTSVLISTTTITVYYDSDFTANDTVLLTYTGTGITDAYSNAISTFSNDTVTNNIIASDPILARNNVLAYHDAVSSTKRVDGSNNVLQWSNLAVEADSLIFNTTSPNYLASDSSLNFENGNEQLYWPNNIVLNNDSLTFVFLTNLTSPTSSIILRNSINTVFVTVTSDTSVVCNVGTDVTFNDVDSLEQEIVWVMTFASGAPAGQRCKFYINGNLKQTSTDNPTFQTVNWRVFGEFSSAINGKVYTVALINEFSTPEQVTEISNYLINKYNIP